MIGSTLRQYVITSKLGEGGMGVVWRARDTILGRDVALKVLPADKADREVRRERFFREARAASALNHPNIITIYEINSVGAVDFIAMELVEGETLGALLSRGRIGVEHILDIARQIADAVGRAHRAGIVHRDLKPTNVMINDDGLVKVLDFGLAKVVDSNGDPDATNRQTQLVLTRDGTAVGTPGYMSPEQALGEPTDARSDVFSFGVILYQMLAGVLPFGGATNSERLRALHLSEPPSLDKVRPDAPTWLVAIVSRLLAKDPNDRVSSMGDVAAALRRAEALPAVPQSAIPTVLEAAPQNEPSPSRRPARRISRRRSVQLLILIFLVALWVVPWRRVTQGSNRQAVPSAGDVGPAQSTEDATELLRRYDRSGNIDRAIELLQRALADNPKYATAYAQLAIAYLAKNAASPDRQWVTLARENADRAVELGPELAVGHVALGSALLDAGNPTEAAAQFERAVELDPLNARALAGLGRVHAAENRDEDARQVLQQAVNADRNDWRSALELGGFHYRRGHYDEAVAAFETAKARSADNAVVLLNLGAAYFLAQRTEEAASTLQRALELNPTGAAYTNFANVRFVQGRFAEAADAFEKAVGLNANNYLVWANLGDAYRWAPGRRGKSPEAYRHAIELLDKQIATKPSDPNLRTRKASYLAKMGASGDALAELSHVPRPQTLTPQMLVRVATVRELAGDRVAALDAIAAALKAGFPRGELETDPEFAELRSDARYHRLTAGLIN